MKHLFKQLAAFQQECPIIHKSTSGYGYQYTSLPQILDVINPIMKKHELGFYQAVNGTTLKTIIFHTTSGETIESDAEIPQNVKLAKMNDFQVLGSAITYMRRYQLSAMLGIVTDKDIDAYGSQEKGSTAPADDAIDIGDQKFDAAVVKLMGSEITVDKILTKYDLTPRAEKKLREIENA